MRTGSGGIPLKTFLTRMIWLSVFPLLVMGFWLVSSNIMMLRDQQRETAEQLVANYVGGMEQFLDARIRALEALAASPLLDDPIRWPDFYAEAQTVQKSFASHVILANADAPLRMLFNTRLPFGTQLPLLPTPQGHAAAPVAISTGKVAVGDSFIGPIAEKRLVAVVVPALRTSEVRYLILILIETQQLQAHLENLSLPPDWAISLRDSQGNVLAQRAPVGFDSARDVVSQGRFIAVSDLAPWSVELEIPRQAWLTLLMTTSGIMLFGLLAVTATGVLVGGYAGRRLSLAVTSLTDPAQDKPSVDIREVTAARLLIEKTFNNLRKSEQQFRHLFDSAPVAMSLCDKDGMILACNNCYEEWFGYPLKDVPSVADWFQRAYPDAGDRSRATARWNTAIGQAASTREIIDAGEYCVVCHNGQKRIVQISATLLDDNILSCFLDVTEQRRAQEQIRERQSADLEQQRQARIAALNQMQDANIARRQAEKTLAALRNSENRLALFIEHAPASLAMFDRHMCYIAYSKRWLEDYGLETLDLSGKNHYEVFPEINEDWKSIHQRCLEGETILREEDPFTRKDGSVQWLRWEVLPWHTSDQAIGGIVVFSEDITERKQLGDSLLQHVQELQRRNAALKRFNYTISHEMRTPLVTIESFLGYLKNDLAEQNNAHINEDIRHIGTATRRMGQLLDSLTQVFRAEKITSPETETELLSLLQDVSEQLSESLDQIHGVIKVSAENLVLRGDLHHLQTIWKHLLSNAVKFIGDQPQPVIEIGTVRTEMGLVFFVRDNGRGVEAQYQEKIFGLFDQLDNQVDGTGLGLALVRQIVELYGGHIWVESAGYGQGSCFYFTLPNAITTS